MKIAVNCWVLRNKQTDGIGNFTIETLKPLISAHPEIHFQVLCDKNFTEDYFNYPNVSLHYIFPARRHPLLYMWYMEFPVKRFLKKQKPDLFLSMDGFLSLRSSCRQLPIIYDLNFEHRPKDLPFRNRVYFRTFFPRFARKAARVATISEYSKQDISNTYSIADELIDNVSCGIKENFTPLNEAQKKAGREKYAEGQEYFFFIGSMHPRKNIVRLIRAFIKFKEKTDAAFKLVLAGNILWDDQSIKSVLTEAVFSKDILFTGRISDEELKLALGSAYALTFVPTFEGFGLPIVEAFQARVPVICSDTTSMPEVAGNAALMTDPFNTDQIANRMEQLYSNPLLRDELITKGDKQKKEFSWDRTASLLYDSMMKCIRS